MVREGLYCMSDIKIGKVKITALYQAARNFLDLFIPAFRLAAF